MCLFLFSIHFFSFVDIYCSAKVSHKSMPKEVREALGILDTTIRVSVGLEDSIDLIKDIEQAFEKTFE